MKASKVDCCCFFVCKQRRQLSRKQWKTSAGIQNRYVDVEGWLLFFVLFQNECFNQPASKNEKWSCIQNEGVKGWLFFLFVNKGGNHQKGKTINLRRWKEWKMSAGIQTRHVDIEGWLLFFVLFENECYNQHAMLSKRKQKIKLHPKWRQKNALLSVISLINLCKGDQTLRHLRRHCHRSSSASSSSPSSSTLSSPPSSPSLLLRACCSRLRKREEMCE